MYAFRRVAKSAYVMVAGLIALGYFLYHAEHGNYGFRAAQDIHARVATLEAELGELQAERQRLERVVELMRPESLDPDMLEERIRTDLGYAGAGELVIMHGE